jgi:aspartyl protease family protein
MGDRGPFVLYYAIIVAAVAGSLLAMRQPIGKMLKIALAWVAIFGVAFLVFAFRSDFSALGGRLRAEATGSSIAEGQVLRIPAADDGHFYVDGRINGKDVRFLIDSGATVTTVSKRTAEAAGLALSSRRAVVQTANGAAQVTQGSANRLDVGPIERTDFPVDVSDQDDLNLLGMNFLRSLKSWRVERDYLVLEA